jgi:hypothetical protein
MNQEYLFYLLFAFCKSIPKKYFGISIFYLLIGITISFNSTLQAQTLPQQITYQGKLVQNGLPFSGSTTMIFELVNSTTNAVAWTETQTINVQDGLYSVVLGSQTPFVTNFFSQNPSLGLRVSVNGNALTPITILRAVPYAHTASSVSDNSITSVKIVNGTIQTIDIASGGQNKVLATDGNGLVTWIDRTSITTATPNLQQVLSIGNDAGNTKITNLDTPTDPQDAANKAYVDAITGGGLQDLSNLDGSITISNSTYNGSSAETISVTNNGITTAKIANDAVTNDKISALNSLNNQILVSDGSSAVSWQNVSSIETDPTINVINSDAVPRWDGLQLVDGSITDDGSNVNISSSTTINELLVNDLYLGGFMVNSLSTASNGGIVSPYSDSNLVTELALTDYLSSQTLNFENGINTLLSGNIGLGGTLTENTSIDGGNNLFQLFNIDKLEFQANDKVEFSIIPNAAFVIEDNATNELFSIKNRNTDVFDLSIDLGTSDGTTSGITIGGSIGIAAQNFTTGSDVLEGANFTLKGGNADGFIGGDIILSGGGGTGSKGRIFLQDDGGDIAIGNSSSPNSELFLNGFLTLPNLSPPFPTGNNLYSNSGNLFWGNQNLSLGANTWEKISNTEIFFNGTLGNAKVGIGNFNPSFPPAANLHIRRIGQEADLRIATLVGSGNLNKASHITLRTAAEDFASNEDNVADNQVIGKMLFEGYNSGTFREAGKIDVRLTDASLFRNEMRFSINGNEKMNINNSEVKIVDTDFTINNASNNQVNLTFNLGTLSTGSGGGLFLQGQNSSDNVSTSTGGYLNMFAGNNLESNGVGGNVNIYAGAGGASGGNVDISAGNGAIRGIVNMQTFGGNIVVGNSSSLNSELQVNGWLSLPSLTTLPSTPANKLYANNTGGLFWGNLNLVAATPWLNDGSDNLYYPTNNGTIGIGDFSVNPPQADLHIKRLGTGLPANIRLTSAQEMSGSPLPNLSGDVIGELTFEGYNGSSAFQEAAKIEVVVTDNSSFLETDMIFRVGGNKIMTLGQNDNVILGNPNNTIDPTANGATISGGGQSTPLRPNSIQNSSAYATISGGHFNRIGLGFDANAAVIGGGFDNIIAQTATSSYSTIGGGRNNRVNGNTATVLGGEGNNAEGTWSVAAGRSNLAKSFGETVIGIYSIPAIGAPSATTFVPTDRLFVVGNGTDGSNRSNALVIFKNGDATFAGDVTANSNLLTSDIRYKKQINTLNNSLSNIQKLRGTDYYWKDENKSQKLQFGVIAQEIEEVFPNLVHTNSEGYKSVNYIGLVPVLIEATKEQQTIIDNQKEELKTQKTELENLKKQINDLKEIVATLQENQGNQNSALAQKVEALEKQLTALVESLSNKTETASLKE